MDLLGLDAAASAVHRALLRRPGLTTDELVADVHLPAETVLVSLAALRERGLLEGTVPVRPDTVLEPALLEVEQQVSATRAALLAARKEIGEMVELYAGGRARSDTVLAVERVEGPDAVQRRLDELSASVTSEVLNVRPTFLDEAQARREDLEAVHRLTARGVVQRTIVGEDVFDVPEWLQHAADLQAAGDRHGVHPDPPVRLLLLDRRVAVLPLDPDAHSEGALFVWSRTLLRTLLLLYESLWTQSEALVQGGREAPEGLHPREQRLLQLLAVGLKDESVARHLGVSVRTVRRESAALLDRLGAGTRFQAGVEAARRGWL